jgi:hypothetical protein
MIKKFPAFMEHECLLQQLDSILSHVVPFQTFSFYVSETRRIVTTNKLKKNSVALVRKRTIPTDRPPLVGEVSANLCW